MIGKKYMIEKERLEYLNKEHEKFIFKDLDDDIWNERVTMILKNIDFRTFLLCLESDPKELLNLFNLKNFIDRAQDTKNIKILEYINSLPSYKDKKFERIAQTQHLLILMNFSCIIVCRQKGIKCNYSLGVYMLGEIFRIIEKEYKNEVDFEYWFKDILNF